MKKVIIAIAVSGIVSLGFTLIKEEAPAQQTVVKIADTQKMDFSHRLDEKRLASWD